MYFTKSEETSEVFDNFLKIAQETKLLDKKSEYMYPAQEFTYSPDELDIGLHVVAAEHEKIYDVTSESHKDLVNQAHPGGGASVSLDMAVEGDLAKVETVLEQHGKLEEIARRVPAVKSAALVEKLVVLADIMDEAGLEKEAHVLTNYAGILSLAHKKKVATPEKDTPESHKYVEHGNRQAQVMINKARKMMGAPPIREDGIVGEETLGAMEQLGIKPGSYRTWSQLYHLIDKATLNLNQLKQRQNYQREPDAQEISHRTIEHGPADIPMTGLTQVN